MVSSNDVIKMGRSYLAFRILMSGIFLIIIGLILIVLNYFANKSNDRFKVWICSKIGNITDTNINEKVTKKRVNKKYVYSTEYVPEIVYKYTIDGMEYSNNKISVTEKKFSSRYECEKFIGNFSSTGLEVCYDPNNKNDSYLIISTKDTYWFYGGGVIAIVIAIIMILNRNTLFAQAATAYDMVT